MHEKHSNFREAKILSGSSDPILRDYLRVSGSPLVTSNSSRTHGLFSAKEIGQNVKRRLGPVYRHRLIYTFGVTMATVVVAIVWG